jgi:hypothetical protein
MAFKYKLKEVTPTDIEKAADTVGSDVMKGVAAKNLSGKDFENLEQILGKAGIKQDKIDKILDMWAERPLFVNPNEGKENPLDEKEEGYYKDPKTGEMSKGSFEKGWKAMIDKIKDEEGGVDPNAKNTFKDKLKETIAKRIKKERGTSRS